MKRVLLSCLFVIGLMQILTAQQVYSETFTSYPERSVPTNWIISTSSDITSYSRPGTCNLIDKGLGTPGVGQGAPVGLIMPSIDVDPQNTNLALRFKVYVFDPNLKCNTSKDFLCPTYVKVYIIPESGAYTSSTVTNEPVSPYAALPDYQLVYANTDNLVIFNNVKFPAGVTKFRFQLIFKAASTSNCASSGTKFIFDDFNLVGSSCVSGCAPIANQDYFNSDLQKLFMLGANSFKGHVFGGYAPWINDLNDPSYIPSATYSPAIDGGKDFDYLNTPLSGVTFIKVSEPVVEDPGSCTEGGSPGSLVFNSNGTFTYTRTSICVKRVSFTYKVQLNSSDPLLESAITKVIIDMPNVDISLPVTFSSFNAQRNRQVVALKWETASEQNNRGFNVQRNTRGVWETVAFVFSGADGGNSDELLSYEYKDANSEKGVSQYRIQQVDLDGKASFSVIRSVKGLEQAGSRTVVYPNPSSDGKVSVVFEDQGAKAVTVTDLSGRIIRQFRNVLNNVQIEGLESGMYSIQITDLSSAVSSTEKVIIKKR